MKNMMLMTSKIATKNFKKIMSLVLILAILILPFINLLNARAENATITVDDNKKVVDTTGLIVKVNESDLNVDETIDSQIVGRYLGLPSGTYYIKQLKAATGYKTATDIASITIEPSSTTYVHLDVENAKQGLLPSTGGVVTLVYTTIGLLVIVLGSIAFVSYRNKSTTV